MIDKVKEQIDINRNDNQTIIDYVDAFKKCEKAKELFYDDDDYKNYIQDEIKEEKNEDEFF